MTLSIIVAMTRGSGIGFKGDMPWHCPEDLQHFKRTTMGHPVIMGRKTHESIGMRLPGRQNIIVTRNLDYRSSSCHVVNSLEDALKMVEGQQAYLIGGAELYEQAMWVADELIVTHLNLDAECDAFFPAICPSLWAVEEIRTLPSSSLDAPLPFRVVRYKPTPAYQKLRDTLHNQPSFEESRARVLNAVTAFLESTRPLGATQVVCNETNNSPEDIAKGLLNVSFTVPYTPELYNLLKESNDPIDPT